MATVLPDLPSHPLQSSTVLDENLTPLLASGTGFNRLSAVCRIMRGNKNNFHGKERNKSEESFFVLLAMFLIVSTVLGSFD